MPSINIWDWLLNPKVNTMEDLPMVIDLLWARDGVRCPIGRSRAYPTSRASRHIHARAQRRAATSPQRWKDSRNQSPVTEGELHQSPLPGDASSPGEACLSSPGALYPATAVALPETLGP
ncbi:UNVERIFIED_CONTAM: hypothetical protein FKN15_044254 [Acipenser sinensis]